MRTSSIKLNDILDASLIFYRSPHMANEIDRAGNPSGGQQYEEGETAKKRPNPFGEQESQGNEQTRRAPGSEQEYQGNEPAQKRAP